MDWPALIDRLGSDIGLLPAVVIAGLAFWGWSERRDARAAAEKRLEREREHSNELMKTIMAVQEVSRVIGGGRE